MRTRLLAVLVAALLSQLAAAPAQAAAPPQLLAMTFNVCGNVCRHGEVSTTAANVAYQARAHGASVVMLQELCYSQFVGVRARLARYGYSGIFAAQTRGGHCDDHDHKHGKGFGLGLFARGKLTGAVARRLPMPSPIRPEPRIALGATVRLAGRSVFVVTSHTSPSGPNLIAQMKALTSWLTPIAARRAVLFGGDLNSMPDNPDLDGLYTSFTEADGDRTNPRPTFRTVPRKIDYLFGSVGHLSRVGAGTSCGRYSDHCAYFGRFR